MFRSGIRGSAVCAFTLSAIDKSFEGAFKEQKTPHSNWLPVADKDVPQPHPALVIKIPSTARVDLHQYSVVVISLLLN